MRDKKVGWMRNGASLSGGPDPEYVFKSEFTVRLLIAGAKSERRGYSVVEFDGRFPFAFRGGVDGITDGAGRQRNRAQAGCNQGFQATVRTHDKEFRKTFSAPDYTLADKVTDRAWLRHGPKLGDSIITRGFSFESLRVELARTRLTATQPIRVLGHTVPCQVMETCKVGDKIPGLEYCDPQNGRILLARQPGLIEVRAKTRRLPVPSSPALIFSRRRRSRSTKVSGSQLASPV